MKPARVSSQGLMCPKSLGSFHLGSGWGEDALMAFNGGSHIFREFMSI
jgi:hypothetical protein